MTMFHMSNDSHLFHTAPGEGRLPLYEAKLLHQFTHRWATYGGAGSGEWGMGSGRAGVGSGRASVGSVGDDESDVFEQALAPHRSVEPSGRPDSPSPATLERGRGGEEKVRAEPQSRELTPAELADPTVTVTPRYWVDAAEVEARLAGRWDRRWLLGFRDITNATNERTAIFSLLPRVGVGHTAPLILFAEEIRAVHIACFLATLNSLVFDFVTRQKVGGTHLTYTYLNQLPVLPPSAF
ncbi:MAG: hypothetical protein NZM42_15125, partial [Gemmatales bacterium]|nr:hypothetical protein [Gemmatales bacterium]